MKDINSGVEYTYNAETPMYLASTVKVIVLMEVFRQVEAETLTLDESIVFKDTSLRDGTKPLKNARVGDAYSLVDLVKMMMQYSDNAATDLIISRVGIDNVNKSIAGLPIGRITSMVDVRREIYKYLSTKAMQMTEKDVFLVRKTYPVRMRGPKLAKVLKIDKPFTPAQMSSAYNQYYDGLLNSGSMKSMASVFEKLYRCTDHKQKSCDQMLDILRGCYTGKSRVRARLPKQIAFAHKTGTQRRRNCDMGILWVTEKQPVIVATCTKNWVSLKRADRLMANLGYAVYQTVRGKPLRGDRSPLVASGKRDR